ncbi:hypothetical protein KSP40_PGU008109 [Platanthera guangdongensis]|uniref:Protein root UVB sensitive 1, chloroplastic n=1 Tax=Platanthera guangdongensis TaxID=2320717 RepID=A0ABR2LPN3_9ASPA
MVAIVGIPCHKPALLHPPLCSPPHPQFAGKSSYSVTIFSSRHHQSSFPTIHYHSPCINPNPHSSVPQFFPSSPPLEIAILDSGVGSIPGNGGSRNGNKNNPRSWRWWWRRLWFWEENTYPFDPDDRNRHGCSSQILFALLCSAYHGFLPSPALASSATNPCSGTEMWEVKGGKWTRLLPDSSSDSFNVAGRERGGSTSYSGLPVSAPGVDIFWQRCRELFFRLMLPEGYPGSVSRDYLEYSLWRAAQGVASQISGVLSTQALLYAVGLGKGAIPTAAAINWVLKDGIGYLSKILLSKYGRHFDVNPKGWRLFADLLENAAYGMEILTPAFPKAFVLIGAAAGAGRSAAALIQAATRSCFYAGFAVNRNFAEVIAKGEAQGMVSKFLGIMLGIALANYIGSSTPMALACFSAVTAVHMYCNFRSYQSIQLRTLNPYRSRQQSGLYWNAVWQLAAASFEAEVCLVFSEYLWSGRVPPIKEVNDEEPFLMNLPHIKINMDRLFYNNLHLLRQLEVPRSVGDATRLGDVAGLADLRLSARIAVGMVILRLPAIANMSSSQILSAEAKIAATEICRRLELGSNLSDTINNKEDASALFNLFRDENYLLLEDKHKFHVILKEDCSAEDMLKSLFHVSYLYWLERNVGMERKSIANECGAGGRLQISLEYAQREFVHAKHDGSQCGWLTDGLVANPLPNRVHLGYDSKSSVRSS